MKKKLLSIFLTVIATLCLCIGFGACTPKEEVNDHIHNWVWRNNASEHWQVCEADNVEKSGSRSAHFDNNEDGKCDECQYAIADKDPDVPTEYTVTYNANGGFFEDGEETKSVKVKENDKLEIPEEPTRDDFKFAHWCTDSSLDTEWNFESDVVTHTTTLYAQWETVIVEHNVTFILNYEGAEEVVKSTENNLITFIPERDDYVFNGWWLSDGQTESGEYILAQKYDTAELVTEDGLVLVAEWVEKSTVSSQLPAPSVSINGNVFSWSGVTGAVSYDIRVYESGSQEEKSRETVFATSWTFPSGYNAGYYTVKIRAMGDGKTTVNSSYVFKSYGHLILSTISKIDFDITSSILTWTAVKNATSYVLYINNAEVETLSYTTYDLSDYEAGEYSIKIVAQRDGYQSSTTTKTIQKLRLKTPNIRLFVDKQNDCYVVMWDSVANADTYLLDFGGTEVKVTDETSYSFDNSASFWKGADSITLSMAAFDSDADYLVSNPTAELTVTQIYTVTIEKNIDGVGTVTTTGAVYIPQTFKIDFDLNGATGKVNTQYVTAKNAITYPTIPTRSGYVFRGWYTTKSCFELYDFTAEVTKDITLYAGWYKITTEGYDNYILDVTSNYNSSSKAYSVSTSGTTSSNAKYMYFRALTSGTYTLYYKNSSSTSNNGTYLNVYNATQVSTLCYNTNITSTSYKSLPMTLEAGDVVYIRNYAYNSSYSATFSFYVTGASTPSAGGLGTDRYLIKGTQDSTSSDLKIIADLNTTITLTVATTDDRYVFDGWYNGDILLSAEDTFEYTVGNENTKITAKWKYSSITLDKNIDAAGTIDNYLDKPIKEGESVTITAKTNNGYMWLGWYEGERLVSRDAKYTFTMTSQSVRYTAHWAVCPIVLTKNMDEAGTISNIYVPLTLGQTITITASTKSGYTWLGWYEGDQLKTSELSFEEKLTEAKKNYEARWACYTLTTSTNDSSAGSFTRKDNVKTTAGQSVTLEARTYSGYTWQGWYENDQLLSESLSFTFDMPEKSVTYTAKWTYYTLTTTRNDSQAGYCSPSYNNTKITAGEQVTLTANTNRGYTWVGWYQGEEEVSTELYYRYTMTKENVSFEARWIKCPVTVRSSDTNAGSVSGLPNTTVIGQEVFLTATPNKGYTFDGWYKGEDRVSTDPSFQITIEKENVTYEAHWTYYTLTTIVNDSQAGYLSKTYSDTKITAGEQVALKATTNKGYTFVGWYKGEDDVSTKLSYQYTMTKENVTLEARWCKVTLSVNDSSAGSVASLTATYKVGDVVTIKATTNKGYTFVGWYKGEDEVSTELSYQYTMTKENVALEARWCKVTLSVNDSSAGSTAPLTSTYKVGDRVTVTATTNKGYTFVGWYKGEDEVSTELSYQYTMTKENVLLEARWTLDSFMENFTFTSDTTTCTISGVKDKGVMEIVVPTYVTSIGMYAFYGCSGLESVIWNAENCTTAGNYNHPIFSDCTNLKTVTFGEGVKTIPAYAFSGCGGLTGELTIPDSVTSIGYDAFSGCSGLTGELTIPDSVTSIGNGAFSGCSGLTSITIPFVGGSKKTAKDTDQYPFGYIFGTTKFDGTSAVTQYYYETSDTSSTTSRTYYIPDLLKSVTVTGGEILYGAFSRCSGLTSVTIGDGVTSIGYDDAFSGCSGLTSITVATGNQKYHSAGNCLIKTQSKTLVLGCKVSVIPQDGSVTSIGIYAFSGCSELTSIVIPDSVTSIGYDAFSGCSELTSIVIPDSVTSIGYDAFSGCSELTSIVIPDNVTSIGRYAFDGCSGLTSVEFKNPNGWKVQSASQTPTWSSLGVSGLSNKTTAATYLTSKYCSYLWNRT